MNEADSVEDPQSASSRGIWAGAHTIAGRGVVNVKIAILDDYQGAALQVADWSKVETYAETTVFRDHLSSEDEVVRLLLPFDGVCVMRERTPLSAEVIRSLPNLKFVGSTGPFNPSIDEAALGERKIPLFHTRYDSSPTVELIWALLLSTVRHLPAEAESVRRGGWQVGLGTGLHGKTLGIVGLGRLGSAVARIGSCFGMTPIAWSENLTRERAEAAGARLVSKTELFSQADVVTVHLALSEQTKGSVDATSLALMKPTAFLINTSRGPIVDEAALIAALEGKRLAGAGLDVFDQEPLSPDHPFRKLPNVVATPHIGFVTRDLYAIFYQDIADSFGAWLEDNAVPTLSASRP